LISHFTIERVHKAGAKFNFEKAIWFNQQYLRHLTTKELSKYCEKEILDINPKLDIVFIEKYCELYRDRISYGHELPLIGKYMYSDIAEYDKDTLEKKWKPECNQFFEKYIIELKDFDFKSAIALEEKTKQDIEAAGLGLGSILPILRIALTGTTKGPSIFDTMLLLGKDLSIDRIKNLPIS
jgi:glutamyl-tRNA synthetase